MHFSLPAVGVLDDESHSAQFAEQATQTLFDNLEPALHSVHLAFVVLSVASNNLQFPVPV